MKALLKPNATGEEKRKEKVSSSLVGFTCLAENEKYVVSLFGVYAYNFLLELDVEWS